MAEIILYVDGNFGGLHTHTCSKARRVLRSWLLEG